MAIENLPIPAENATIARGQIYQLTGLTEATRYKFIVTSTKCPHVVIAKDEALEQVEAEGYLSGRAFYFVTEAAAPEFQYDGNITIQNQNVVLTNVVGEAGAQGLLPLTAAEGIVTGKNLRGTLIFSQGTALGAGQRAAVASFQIPTGGDAGTFKGTAVITFVGNIA